MPLRTRTLHARIARYWPLLLSLAAIVAVFAWLMTVSERLDAQDAKLQELLSRLEATAGSQQAIPVPSRTRALGGGPSAVAFLSAPQGSEASNPDAGQLAHQERARQRNLATSFSRQPRDADATRAELGMLAAMDNAQLTATGLVPRDPDVDCKRDMCRISATFRSEADAADWSIYYLTALTPGTTRGAEQAITRNADGSVQMALYAERVAKP